MRPFLLLLVNLLCISSSIILYGQTGGAMYPHDDRRDNPGIRGRVFGAHGMGRHNLIVVTDQHVTKIYGETRLEGVNINYSIPNLPRGETLLIHYLYSHRAWATEKFVVDDWVEKNISIRLDSYNTDFLEDRFGAGPLSFLLLAGHLSEIWHRGRELNASAALFQKIHYLRLLGSWEITDIKIDNWEGPSIGQGGVFTFHRDGNGNGPSGDPFYWKCYYQKTGEERRYGFRTGIEYHLVITMSAHKDFNEAGEMLADIHFDNFCYRAKIDDYMYLKKLTEEESMRSKAFNGSFSFRLNPTQRRIISERVGGHMIELDFDPVQRLEVNLYFDGIYYDLYNVRHGMGGNSTFFWEPGAKIVFNENTNYYYLPIIFEVDIKQDTTGNELDVEVHVRNNPDYLYNFDITDFLGDYYAPHSDNSYRFYMQGEGLYVRTSFPDSPYFSSGKLEPFGYRTYTRDWLSAHGRSSVSFSFNTGRGGFIIVNVMGDLIDYPSQGYFLYRRK